MSLSYTAPPALAGATDTFELAFAAPASGAYTNNAGTGAIAFTPLYTVAPASLALDNLTFASGDSLQLQGGLFSYNPPADDSGDAVTPIIYGVYAWSRVSPRAGYLQLIETDWLNPGGENDYVLTFASSATPSIFALDSDPYTLEPWDTAPTLSALRSRKVHFAPASVSGRTMSFTPQGQTHYSFNCGDATLGASSAGTNAIDGAANYIYTRTGANTARLSYSYYAPPLVTNLSGALLLLFTSARGGVYFNTNGFEAGSFSSTATINTAPASLAGRTIIFGSGANSRDGALLQFAGDSVTLTIGGQVTMTNYQLVHPSPGVLVLCMVPYYWQFTFSSPAHGTAFLTTAEDDAPTVVRSPFSLR